MNKSRRELDIELQRELREMPPPDWVVEMHEHFRLTGSYRPEDLRRVLGDPTRGVDVGPDVSLSALLCSRLESNR